MNEHAPSRLKAPWWVALIAEQPTKTPTAIEDALRRAVEKAIYDERRPLYRQTFGYYRTGRSPALKRREAMNDPKEALREAHEKASQLDAVWDEAAERLEEAEYELANWAEDEARRKEALIERIDGRCFGAARIPTWRRRRRTVVRSIRGETHG